MEYFFFIMLHIIEFLLLQSLTLCPMPSSFLTYFDIEGIAQDARGIYGEFCQAMLISGSSIGVANFFCFDEDLFIWDRSSLDIY